jgi:uncharacterized iron-regulated protein
MKNVKKITRENIANHLLEYQFELIGKSLKEAEENENWLKDWDMSQEQYEQFKTYAVPLLKKIFKCNTNRAKATFEWFDLQYGLKIKSPQ